jgi:hypothetical protein
MKRHSRAARVAAVLWPSFVLAAAALGVFFSVFDPQELYLFSRPSTLSREASYTIGFFLFWAFGAACAAAAIWLLRKPRGEGSREV